MFDPIDFAKEHPVQAGAIVFVGGAAILYFLGFFGSSSSSSANSGQDAASAYYAAESAQGQAGDELQAVQIEEQAQTEQTALNDSASQNINSTWAGANVTTNASNNATALGLAPFQATESLYSALGGIASQPPLTSTSYNSSSNNGFFGLGASSSSGVTTSQVANPSAVGADELLGDLVNNGYHAQS